MTDPIERLRGELTAGLEAVKEHAKNNVATQLLPIREDIQRLFRTIYGDGNGSRGIIRDGDERKHRIATLEGRMNTVETTGNKILDKLEALEKRSVPPSSRSDKGKLGLSPTTIQYIVVGVLAALGAGVSTAGSKAVMAPSEKAVDATAEALAAKRADLERKERWLKWRERQMTEHPSRTAPEQPEPEPAAEPPSEPATD